MASRQRFAEQVLVPQGYKTILARDGVEGLRKALTETALDGIVQLVIVLTTLAVMLLYSVTLTVASLVAMSLAGLLYFLVLPSARSPICAPLSLCTQFEPAGWARIVEYRPICWNVDGP